MGNEANVWKFSSTFTKPYSNRYLYHQHAFKSMDDFKASVPWSGGIDTHKDGSSSKHAFQKVKLMLNTYPTRILYVHVTTLTCVHPHKIHLYCPFTNDRNRGSS